MRRISDTRYARLYGYILATALPCSKGSLLLALLTSHKTSFFLSRSSFGMLAYWTVEKSGLTG